MAGERRRRPGKMEAAARQAGRTEIAGGAGLETFGRRGKARRWKNQGRPKRCAPCNGGVHGQLYVKAPGQQARQRHDAAVFAQIGAQPRGHASVISGAVAIIVVAAVRAAMRAAAADSSRAVPRLLLRRHPRVLLQLEEVGAQRGGGKARAAACGGAALDQVHYLPPRLARPRHHLLVQRGQVSRHGRALAGQGDAAVAQAVAGRLQRLKHLRVCAAIVMSQLEDDGAQDDNSDALLALAARLGIACQSNHPAPQNQATRCTPTTPRHSTSLPTRPTHAPT